ncbi:MAG TPA: hypothetical protein VI197_03385 [Polyangiaceae bacterium]
MNSSVCLPGPLLLVLVLANGCGGKDASNAHPPDGTGTITSGGSQSTGDTGGPTTDGPSSSGTSSSTGTSSSGGTSSGGGSGGTAGGDTSSGGTAGGASMGGSSAGSSGAGGESCIDACELYGSACCLGSEPCLEPGDSCVIDILSTGVDVIYEYDDLEQEIAELPQDILVSIADTDIEFAAADPSPAKRFEFTLTAEASELHGALLDGVRIQPFWLSCNGQRLFAGVTYLSYGAAAIQTPVLHLGRNDEGRWVLALGAWQAAWFDTTSSDPAPAERMDRAELRAAFCQRGAMRELDPEALPPDL